MLLHLEDLSNKVSILKELLEEFEQILKELILVFCDPKEAFPINYQVGKPIVNNPQISSTFTLYKLIHLKMSIHKLTQCELGANVHSLHDQGRTAMRQSEFLNCGCSWHCLSHHSSYSREFCSSSLYCCPPIIPLMMLWSTEVSSEIALRRTDNLVNMGLQESFEQINCIFIHVIITNCTLNDTNFFSSIKAAMVQALDMQGVLSCVTVERTGNSGQRATILPSRRIVTVPDTFRKCPHCPIIFLNKVHLGKHLEKQHTQHHQQRQCQNCKLSFYTYEYNKICDECLTEIRKNIIEKTSKNYETSSSISQLFCRDCNLKYPTKMILDLHCLSTGHNMDCGDKNFNIKQKELIGPENSSKLSSKSIQVENEIKDEFVMKDENHFLHKVNEDKTTSAEFQRKITYRTKQYSNRKNNTTCEICGLDFHSKTSRYGHMRTEHPSHFQFECRICEERFIRESAAKEHEKHHVLGELQCPACSMRFIHMAHLQNHTKKNHPKFSNFPCQYCSSITPSVEALHSHIKIHHGDCLGLPDAFPCGICSEVFHTGTAVSAHRSNYHPGTTFCRICNSQVSKRYLKKHINAVHTKEKTHNCVSCDKIFFSRTSLNNHRKRHHAPRKHLCHLCGKGYVFNVELQRHLKAHRNQRDFKCDFCGRSFLKAGELTYHRRSHTGERPHKCSQCHETFVRPLALRKHIQNKHTENKKRKYLRYSKRKIDELASSVIMESNRDENLQQHGRNHGTLGEMAPINLESSQLSSIDLEKNQGLGQVFGNVNMVPNHRAQHSSDMTGLPSGDNQMLSIGSGQLELSGVVEDELLEMSSDLLIDDVRETTDEATAVGGLREVTAAADGQAQAQPVQVIYVQF
ncbi:unnamed protein product, partial [Meganyctiphanes norvegica]